jgi:NitT/TauT family transport system substrate-binding protein
MKKLRVGLVTRAFFYTPYWAALRNGWYEQLGLEVELIDKGGIDAVTEELKAGTIEIGIGSPEHVIHDVEAGGQLRMVGGNVNRLTHSLIAQPEIKTLKDLKGKIIGVSAMSGGTSSLFVDILEREGLKYPGDYTMVEAGPVPPRHAKLMSREIDAGMQTDPHNYLAEDSGFTNLGPVSDWIPYFQFSSINVRKDWADQNRRDLVAFLTASIKASSWVFENRVAAVDLAAQTMEVERRYADRAWEDHVGIDALPVDLHLNFKSIQTCMDMIARDRSSNYSVARTSTPGTYVDTTYLSEAQRDAGVPERLLI